MKILVVEDEVYSRQSMVKQIQDLDVAGRFEILEAADGMQGWELFCNEAVELVLTDIKMPFLNGLELLQRILEQQPGAKVVIVSGYADFDYAREALNHGAAGYLLKPVKDEELEAVLQKFAAHSTRSKEKLLSDQEDFLTQYIRRSLASDSVEDYVGDSVFARVFPQYRFLCLYLSGKEPPGKEEASRRIKEFQETMTGVELRAMEFSPRLWEMLLRETPQTMGLLEKAMGNLAGGDCRWKLAVSGRCSGQPSLRAAEQQALTALKYKIISGRHPLFYEEIVAERNKNLYPEKEQLQLMRLHLEKGGEEGWKHALGVARGIVQELLADPHASLAGLEELLRRVTAMLRDLVVEEAGQQWEPTSPAPDLLEFDSPEELLNAIARRMKQACETVRSANPIHGESVADAVLAYIDKNYDKDFSLKYLAENVFFMNHAYLSHLISEKTGTSFSRYLQQVRIEKAKEFLAEPELSITEVASLAGYNDTSRFIQVFKKVIGVTPKKYRDRI